MTSTEGTFGETEEATERNSATSNLLTSLSPNWSRRTLLKGAATSAAGITAAGVALANMLPAEASSGDFVHEALSIARTAEQLAVTFYTHGINNHARLGINGRELTWLKAAVVEEQIHLNFFKANGGASITDTFSFPHGDETFESKRRFIETQQQLEFVFDSAFLAAIKELSERGLHRFAQIMGQIAVVEAEHRVLGRVILDAEPANNIAYGHIFFQSVLDAPKVVTDAGYLSPKSGNSYKYHQVDDEFPGVTYTKP